MIRMFQQCVIPYTAWSLLPCPRPEYVQYQSLDSYSNIGTVHPLWSILDFVDKIYKYTKGRQLTMAKKLLSISPLNCELIAWQLFPEIKDQR